jgi:hypothetical protein
MLDDDHQVSLVRESALAKQRFPECDTFTSLAAVPIGHI